MVSPLKRLNRVEFASYFASGIRFHDPSMTLIYFASPVKRAASVVVGKKVSKKAVTRNTIRRQLYGTIESFFIEQAQTGIFIVITKPTIVSVPRKARHEALKALLARTTDSR